MTNFSPSVSIVINTLNRGPLLEQAINSFNWLKYDGEFEVVVVNGPSTDNSADVIKSFGSRIKTAECDVANLSVSRNIGICRAEGDIVAFIDDDAVPEPEWLTQLTKPYTDPYVGGAGGLVYNHTGYDFQYRYCLLDRFGNPDLTPDGPSAHLNFPASGSFPHLLGCNCSFRRSALLEIGGFDEEYEYFLDESDVCLRIVDAGYIIAQVDGAYVHHKYAPSNIRSENRIPKYRYPVVKNKIYFTLKHSRDFFKLEDILREHDRFIKAQRADVSWAVKNGLLKCEDAESLETDIEKAQEVGLRRGFEGVLSGTTITPEKQAQYTAPFLEFAPLRRGKYQTIVMVSNDFPPGHGGGVARFNHDLARALARRGHIVHVVTTSADINRVDLEEGVWVHRMVVQQIRLSTEAESAGIPQHIWNWSATALKEVRRIETHRKIDVVETPIWNCEGIAFAYEKRWPLVTSLQTSLANFLDNNPDLLANDGWMSSFGRPMLAAEREMIEKSDAIRSISDAIRTEIEYRYDMSIPDSKVMTLPLGMPDILHQEAHTDLEAKRNKRQTILFVGRLETRKGIDTLLQAAPLILERFKDCDLRIIGDDTLRIPGLRHTYREQFEDKFAGQRWADRVIFEGRVDEQKLQEAYLQCDLLIAPSRFESFGLIFVEAMRAGKPVIGCRAGGMPEVITHGETGFLVEAGDVRELASRAQQLLENEALARKMGRNGRKNYLDRFTSSRMAEDSEKLIHLAKANAQAVLMR